MKDILKGWISLVVIGILVCSWVGCGGDQGSRAERPDDASADTAMDDDQADMLPQVQPPEPLIETDPLLQPQPSNSESSPAAMRTFAPANVKRLQDVPHPDAPAATEKVEIAKTPRKSDGLTEVGVYYATDRNRDSFSMVVRSPSKLGLWATGVMFAVAVGLLLVNRIKSGLVVGVIAVLTMVSLNAMVHLTPVRAGCSYGSQRGDLVRGYAVVTVPQSHVRGVVERPSILRLEFSEDKNRHIVVANAEELDIDSFYQKMSGSVDASQDLGLMVFIHGYNVDFDSAIRRTAQIATDLSIRGVPVCYSWPSQGSLVGYTVDENNVRWTVPHLREFLMELAEQSHAKSINIISHSMGNRAMTESLAQISRQHSENDGPIFDQVVLAAPDVDADHFRDEIAPLLANVARHVTLYASSDDQALVASKHLHGGYARAGESGENLVVVKDVETIDVSGIDLSLLGHSYYGSSESILQDLLGVVRNRLPASERIGLISRRLNKAAYWMIPRPQRSELNARKTPVQPTKAYLPIP